MARGLAEGAYRILEALYGYRVTENLLRARGIEMDRERYLRRELGLYVSIGVAAAAAFLAGSVLSGVPILPSAVLSIVIFLEAFALSAGLRGRALLARGRKGAHRPRRAPRVNLGGLISRLFREDRVRHMMDLSGIMMPTDYFYGVATRSALIGAVAGALALGALAVVGHYSMVASALWILSGAIAGLAVGIIAPYAYISYRSGSRSSRIEQDLSTWAAAMMAYVSSGASFPDALRRSTSALRDGPLRRELERILRDSEVLGSDPRTSLLATAQRSPSQLLRELIVGLIDAMDSGKDLQEYFRESLMYILNNRRNYLRKLVNDMSLAAELFVMLFVVTPLLLAIILAVMGSMSVGAQPYYGELLAVIAFVFVPLVGVGYLLLVDSIYPRWW